MSKNLYCGISRINIEDIKAILIPIYHQKTRISGNKKSRFSSGSFM
jgi:hypothetical protein